jgi:hypothetical protein
LRERRSRRWRFSRRLRILREGLKLEKEVELAVRRGKLGTMKSSRVVRRRTDDTEAGAEHDWAWCSL